MRTLYILATFFAIAFFYCTKTTAQLSDSLYNALPPNIKPASKNNMAIVEKQRILMALDTFDLAHYRHELGLISALLVKDAQATNDTKVKIADLSAAATYYGGFLPDSSIIYYKKVLALINSDPQYSNSAQTANLVISEMYFYIDKYDSAMPHLLTALGFATQRKDTVAMVRVYNDYSAIYFGLQRYENAIYYASLALQTYPAALRWNILYVRYSINLASMYNHLYTETHNTEHKDSAVSILRTVMQHEQANAAHWYQICYFLLGDASYQSNDYKQALVLFDSSLLPVYNKTSWYAKNYSYREFLYKGASLIKLGRYAEGKKILDSIEINAGNYALKQVAFEALSEAAAAMGNYKQALLYYRKLKLTADSANIQAQTRRVFDSELKYQTAQSKADIALLENKNLQSVDFRNKIVSVAIIVVLVLAITILLLYLRTKRQQLARLEERQKLTDELNAFEQQMEQERLLQRDLQEQKMASQRKAIAVNMHDEVSSGLAALRFLITDLKKQTHNSEVVDVLTDIEEEANNVYIQSRNFMHNLNQQGAQENYNIIELLQNLARRFDEGSGLHINIHIDKTAIEKHFTQQQHAEMYRVIKEAVANSMKHSGSSQIHITVQHRQGMFYFEIRDNGTGINPEFLQNGLGMAGINQHIAAMHGQASVNSSKLGTVISGSFPVADN